jgi:hypothetical protein
VKLSEFKRLPAGAKLRLVKTAAGPCDLLRVVSSVTTRGIFFSGDGIDPPRLSFLRFPDSLGFAEEDGLISIREMGVVVVQYKIVETGGAP